MQFQTFAKYSVYDDDVVSLFMEIYTVLNNQHKFDVYPNLMLERIFATELCFAN